MEIDQAYDDGWKCWETHGKNGEEMCPYSYGTELHNAWMDGFCDAKDVHS